MTSLSKVIHDVEFQHYAYSPTGELGTRRLSSCVGIIIVFANRTVLIEHRSASELWDEGESFEPKDLFEDIVDDIIAMKQHHLNISCVLIIGGCSGNTQKQVQASLVKTREDFLNKNKHESNSSNDLLLQIYRATKVLDVCRSIEEKDEYRKNDQFIDVLITHGRNDSLYLVLRQCVHLFDENTEQKTAICCGYLQYELPVDHDLSMQQDGFSLAGAQFYVNKDILGQYEKEEKDYSIIHDTLMKFDENVRNLGAVSINTNAIGFIISINSMFNHLVTSLPPDQSWATQLKKVFNSIH
ncbi:unnamed protein product [Adineta ricciae]|uniref:Uncharacterized protein n=1 Tax=Adineta ricciae TaxID=249248 RepID=A0A815EK12_ADIRI|nr:unnamed protein product [Adineta ricciae]CAF1311060.1 unnamed protein product [Adineta ricciae]